MTKKKAKKFSGFRNNAFPCRQEKESVIPLESLMDNIPDFDWSKGHSGVLLSDEIADKLIKLLNKE